MADPLRRKSSGTPGDSVAIAEPSVQVVSSNDDSVSSGWTSENDIDAVGGVVLKENTPGSSMDFRFKGANLWIRFKLGTDRGKAVIAIDGAETVTMDLYNAQEIYKYAYIATGLDATIIHTVTITISSDKNASSTDYYIYVDAFAYSKTAQSLTIHDIQYIDLINVINAINRIGLIQSIEEIDKVRGLNWYDRNPTSVGKDYDASLAAHATTERISYTVPADKICIVEMLSINAARTSASGGDEWVEVKWYHTPSGGAKTKLQTVNMFGNAIGDNMHWSLGGTLTLFEGDKITMETRDVPNAGGSVAYECGFKGTEFDT